MTVDEKTGREVVPPECVRPAGKNRPVHVDPDEVRRRAYTPASLSIYSFGDRLMVRATYLLLRALIRIVCATIKWEVRGMEHLDSIYRDGRRAIFTFWHSEIFQGTWFWRNRGIVVMSSRSRDAEYTARLIQSFGYGTARGSASRGSARALAEMSECLSCGIDVGFTIDGPRGPARVAKPGAVILARHSGQAIFPFHITTRRHVKLSSWDRLQIPLPFTRGIMIAGEPILVPKDASPGLVEEKQQMVQSTLDRLADEAEQWRAALTPSESKDPLH